MAGQQDGYEAEFVEEVPDRYICNICIKPLRNPHLVVCCGQHYCQSCLYWCFEYDRTQEKCPHCRAYGREFQHVINRSLKREILALQVRCSHHKEGCKWIGELGSLNDHLCGCGYVEVECPNKCYKIVTWEPITHAVIRAVIKIKRQEVIKHLKEECCERDFQCGYCGERDKYVDITGKGFNFVKKDIHYLVCPEMTLQCPNDCGEHKIKRKDIDTHCTLCPQEMVSCPYSCKTKQDQEITDSKMLRKYLDQHLKECYLRPYKCEFCNLESTYEAITGNGLETLPVNHYHSCQEYPLPCPNQCGTTGIPRKDMPFHRSQCPEETVQCPNRCPQAVAMMKRKQLSHHTMEECPLRPYTCQYCARRDTYKAITKHYNTCPMYPLECRNKCGATEVLRKNMMSHLDKCPLQSVDCPFAEAGCRDKPVRQDLEKHKSTMQEQHLEMMMGTIRLMKDDHQREIERLEYKLRECTAELLQTRATLDEIIRHYFRYM